MWQVPTASRILKNVSPPPALLRVHLCSTCPGGGLSFCRACSYVEALLVLLTGSDSIVRYEISPARVTKGILNMLSDTSTLCPDRPSNGSGNQT